MSQRRYVKCNHCEEDVDLIKDSHMISVNRQSTYVVRKYYHSDCYPLSKEYWESWRQFLIRRNSA